MAVPISAAHFLWGRIQRHKYVVDSLGNLRFDELYDAYPITDQKIGELVKRYGVNYLLVPSKASFEHYDVDQHTLLLDSQDARIYLVQEPGIVSSN